MKQITACLVVSALACWLPVCTAVTAETKQSPLSRVVELLKELGEKLESDLKTEESLYEKYVCWATTVINAKTASNAKAQSRIDSLNTYISDLEAGRVELTTERQDLTKELADLNGGLEEAEAQRDKEAEDFEEAEAELQQAITALEQAIDVLKSATQPGTSFLVANKQKKNQGTVLMDPRAVALALDIGGRMLSKGDQAFLQSLLTRQVPDGPSYDWKKLNREATFKMKYEARSGEILKVLENLLTTFQTNLRESQAQEQHSQNEYSRLHTAKSGQRDATAAALSRLDEENGARGLAKSEAQDEVDALTDQVNNDAEYIRQVTDSLDAKKEEWKARKDLRMKEMEAVSQAVAILHSDDARDLFKRSLASQGYSLLQVGEMKSSTGLRLKSVASILKATAQTTGDKRLLAIAGHALLSGKGHFDAVIDAIDKMVAALQNEEGTDLQNKEHCEQERASDARDAITAARTIDEHSDTITTLLGEIAEIEETIKEKNEEIKAINEEMQQARRIREDEHKEWKKTDADDEEAADTVQRAIQVLKAFYSQNSMSLSALQRAGRAGEAPVVTAGEAPPPPPPTWESPQYSGATGESGGVVAALEIIHEDILSDRQAAQTAETNAKKAYDQFVKDSEGQIETLGADIGRLEGDKSGKETDLGSTRSQRLTKKGELDSVMQKIKGAVAGCSFLLVNYNMRLSNRQIEIDGLLRAKAILQGALPVTSL